MEKALGVKDHHSWEEQLGYLAVACQSEFPIL